MNHIARASRVFLMILLCGISSYTLSSEQEIREKEKAFPSLHIACSKEDPRFDMIESLIGKGYNVNFREPLYSFTPLHCLIRYRLTFSSDVLDCMRLLLVHNADIEARDALGETPLLRACRSEQRLDTIKLLIQYGAAIDVQDKKGRTPLSILLRSLKHAVTFAGTFDTDNGRYREKQVRDSIVFLIQQGANIDSQDSKERNPVT